MSFNEISQSALPEGPSTEIAVKVFRVVVDDGDLFDDLKVFRVVVDDDDDDDLFDDVDDDVV